MICSLYTFYFVIDHVIVFMTSRYFVFVIYCYFSLIHSIKMLIGHIFHRIWEYVTVMSPIYMLDISICVILYPLSSSLTLTCFSSLLLSSLLLLFSLYIHVTIIVRTFLLNKVSAQVVRTHTLHNANRRQNEQSQHIL